MTNRLLPFVAFVVLAVTPPVFAADGIKIASVDLAKIAQESKAGAKAKQTLEKVAETLGKGLKKKEAELDRLKAALTGKEKQLTAKERSVKEKEFQKKVEAYRQAVQDAQKELRSKEEASLTRLLTEVETATRGYAPKNGYALVIRKGDLIYSDGKNPITDITDDVLKALDNPSPDAAPKQDAPAK